MTKQIVPQPFRIEAEAAKARLIAAAPALVELLNDWIQYTEWREDFLIEDAEDGNENLYTRTRTLLKTLNT